VAHDEWCTPQNIAAQGASVEIVEAVDLDEFWALPEIASFLPLRFSSRAEWNEFTGQCSGCKEDILRTHLRGHVQRVDVGTFEIRALGYCASCALITRFSYCAHDDMSITGKSPGSGIMTRWASGATSELQ
jgi:hypothetical protein